MAEEFVVTAVGPDRVGIVADFTADVYAAGANLTKTRMVKLGGHFVLVALVEGADDVLDTLKLRLTENAPLQDLTYKFASTPTGEALTGMLFQLKTYSLDQQGIVNGFSTFLHSQGINIEELETNVESAVGDGTRVFIMRIVMLVPFSTNINVLRRALEAVGDKLNCSIALERVTFG